LLYGEEDAIKGHNVSAVGTVLVTQEEKPTLHTEETSSPNVQTCLD